MDKPAEQFLQELEQLNSYIEYMQLNFYLRFKFVQGLDGAESLRRLVNQYSFDADTVSAQKRNYRVLKKLMASLEALLSDYEQRISSMREISRPRMTKKVKQLFEEGNFREYEEADYWENDISFYEHLSTLDPEVEKRHIDAAPGSDEFYSQYTVNDYKRALEIMKYDAYMQEREELEMHYNLLKDYPVHFKLFDMHNPVNIYRQSFISLMASFDAAIFDLFRKIYKKDFFAIEGLTGKSAKISLASFNSYEDLREKTSEEYLGKVYVSELLRVLHKYNAALFMIDHRDVYDDLCEVISRRNAHIHNKGKADQKYFEKGNGATKYGIKKGQYLPIDSLYYRNASDLLKKFILNFN